MKPEFTCSATIAFKPATTCRRPATALIAIEGIQVNHPRCGDHIESFVQAAFAIDNRAAIKVRNPRTWHVRR